MDFQTSAGQQINDEFKLLSEYFMKENNCLTQTSITLFQTYDRHNTGCIKHGNSLLIVLFLINI